MGCQSGSLLVAVICTVGSGRAYNDRVADRSYNEIDNFIFGMKFSPDQVLSYKGDSIESVPVRIEGKVDDTKSFIVITREKKTAQNGKSEIGVVTANEHIAYPGNLLLANRRLVDNSPDVLAIDRAPLYYTVDLPGLTKEGSFQIIPSFAEYQSAKEKTLKIWFEKFPKDHSVVANFQSDLCFAYSKELLRTTFGMEFKNSPIETSIDFSAMSKQEKLIMIYKFKQIYYTVSVEPTKKPSDLFGPEVTLADLKQKTDSDNPPVMVDSVSYGRTIYVKLETSSTDEEAKTALNAAVSLVGASSIDETELKQKLSDLDMRVFVLGGSCEQVDLVSAQSFKEINEIILNYSNFTRCNLGYPISYSTQFIKDNSRAVIQLTTDYIETTREVFKKGIIKLVHHGWYVMKWFVTWDLISYDEDGNKVVTEDSWKGNGRHKTLLFEEEIELPGNTEDIHVTAMEVTGLPWDWWRTVFDRSGVPLIHYRKFVVYGIGVSPSYEIIPPI